MREHNLKVLSYLLVCKSGTKVDHGLPELIPADGPIIVMVKHLESSFDILHLITASLDNLKTNTKEVRFLQLAFPLTVGLQYY